MKPLTAKETPFLALALAEIAVIAAGQYSLGAAIALQAVALAGFAFLMSGGGAPAGRHLRAPALALSLFPAIALAVFYRHAAMPLLILAATALAAIFLVRLYEYHITRTFRGAP
ncbi:MAG: hypothetical protein JXA08_09115 [Methanomicrobiaceae archaeon]|nr:hypothetical protein [Methanomicrobiaceae archaeon]